MTRCDKALPAPNEQSPRRGRNQAERDTVEIIYLLIPLSLMLVGGIVWASLRAARSGQFDDPEGPAQRILMDDDQPGETPPASGDKEKSEGR